MKKLNRKGFTLIELLAVIVILAIILVVTVPNIINSINDARISSLHNLAVSVANTYDTAFAQDLVATDANKLLGDIPERMTTSWQCIGATTLTSTTGQQKALSEILGLSSDDVVLEGTAPTGTTALTTTQKEAITSVTTGPTCSSIRVRNGAAEVLLVATNGGKFYVAQYYTYAISSESAGAQNAAS